MKVAKISVGSPIFAVSINVQPLSSVTVTEYKPAPVNPVLSETDPLDQLYEYGGVPPETVIDADQSGAPKQVASLTFLILLNGEVGSRTVKVSDSVQNLSSVTVKSYVPSGILFKSSV